MALAKSLKWHVCNCNIKARIIRNRPYSLYRQSGAHGQNASVQLNGFSRMHVRLQNKEARRNVLPSDALLHDRVHRCSAPVDTCMTFDYLPSLTYFMIMSDA